MRTRRTQTSLILAASAAMFAAAGCDQQPLEPQVETGGSPVSPLLSARGPLAHHASFGGPDVCVGLGARPGCDANNSLVANQYADGSVSGEWQDSFGYGNGGFHVVVDCLLVVGNQAVVGGVVTQGPFGGVDVGTRALMSMWDNGTSANDPRDEATATFSGFGPEVGCDYYPPSLFRALGFERETTGQVVVW